MTEDEPEFLRPTKEALDRDLAKFGTLPKPLIALFKKRKGREAECMAACTELLAREPENYAVMLYLGTMHDEKKEYREAVGYYRMITKNIPMLYHVWLRQGMAELLLHEASAARDSLMQYGYLKPGEWFPSCLIALTFLFEDKKEVALYFLDELIKTGNMDRPERVVWFKGLLEETAGDTSEALIHYIESMMMGGESAEEKAMTALKIRELAAKESGE